MSDVMIAGRRVTFRERIPLRIGARLPAMAAAIDNSDWLTFVPVMQVLIESWEFEGSPCQAESYDELDLFSEVMPLAAAVGTELTQRMADQNPKASVSVSS
jgi:hypothetical protein